MDKIFAGYAARTATLKASSNPFARGIAWISGELVPLSQAQIPLMDQGFLHSDLIYDVPSIWDGRFFRLEDHLSRLEASCHKLRLRLPLPKDQINRILNEMAVQSGIRDGFIAMIVTRGLVGVRGSQPDKLLHNNLYMFIQPYIWVMEPDEQRRGGCAIVARTVKRTPVESMDPTVKNLQWGDLTRGLLEAADRGAIYPFLTDGDGHLTEGSGFNIVLVKDGVLFTPGHGVLEGVTRKSVLEIARANGIDARVEFVPVEMLYHCDEVFVCTTAGGIMPVTSLDGMLVKDGKIGPVTRRIWDEYWAMHYDSRYSYAIDYGDSVPRNSGTPRSQKL